MKKHKNKVIAAAVIVIVLVAAFFWGGTYPKPSSDSELATTVSNSMSASAAVAAQDTSAPEGQSNAVPPSQPLAPDDAVPPSPSNVPAAGAAAGDDAILPPTSPSPPSTSAQPPADSQTAAEIPSSPTQQSASSSPNLSDPNTGQDQYQTDPVPSDAPMPVEPQDMTTTNQAKTCTLEVRCDTIFNNLDLLSKDKWELVPKDGVIFAKKTVTFYEGESVLNLLQREMKKAGIQMQFKNTPLYHSAYIESINNLYEFDVGELSGWMYEVNGCFPNYGCSRYQLQQDDEVKWLYSCDLGKDIGGANASGGNNGH